MYALPIVVLRNGCRDYFHSLFIQKVYMLFLTGSIMLKNHPAPLSPSLQGTRQAEMSGRENKISTHRRQTGDTHYELLMACLLLDLSQKTRVSLLSQSFIPGHRIN